MAKKGIYKVVFVQLGEIYELYAEAIYQSDMYGFIEIEEYIFDQNSQIVVDPNEEKLKNRPNEYDHRTTVFEYFLVIKGLVKRIRQ